MNLRDCIPFFDPKPMLRAAGFQSKEEVHAAILVANGGKSQEELRIDALIAKARKEREEHERHHLDI